MEQIENLIIQMIYQRGIVIKEQIDYIQELVKYLFLLPIKLEK
jgi:hypothetical protein